LLANLFAKIDAEEELSREDLIALLHLDDEVNLEKLYFLADRIREAYVGNEVHMRGLIEFSNYCRKNCNYCGIRAGNQKLQRYRMQEEEILAVAIEAEKLGYRTVVLQSGEDPFYTVQRMENIIQAIKQQTDLAITLSIGERPRQEYEQLFTAGADRFLLRFETSNPDLYAQLPPDSDYIKRMNSL